MVNLGEKSYRGGLFLEELERMSFVGVLLALTLQIQIQIGFRAKDGEPIVKVNGT